MTITIILYGLVALGVIAFCFLSCAAVYDIAVWAAKRLDRWLSRRFGLTLLAWLRGE